MAILALINFCLVLLDMSYFPWRDFYLQKLPTLRFGEVSTQNYGAQLTEWYGVHFKGIEPYRATELYLATVDQLSQQIQQTGESSPEVAALLRDLQVQSIEIINENPFQVARRSGTLEKIKHLMRARMRDRIQYDSAKQAFQVFWSPAYLAEVGWMNVIGFFDQHIRPLMTTNFYRAIGENGNPIDLFWKIDIWFMSLFALEFLARTYYLSRVYRNTSWLETMVWRWYDVFLFLPFWRWLRVIPVTLRLSQAKLIDLEPLSHRLFRDSLANYAVELTEIVVIRVIDEMQDLIKEETITRWFLQPNRTWRYVDLNGINEVEAISQRLTHLLMRQVLPQVKPQVDSILHYSVTSVMNQTLLYRGLQAIPGVNGWSNQLTQRIVSEVSSNIYNGLAAALEDPVLADLTQQLTQKFTEALKSELQQEPTLGEIRSLVIALLEEIKINYAERISEADDELLREQTKRLVEITQGIEL